MRLTELEVDPRPVALARIALGVATVLNALEMFVLLGLVSQGRLAMPVLSFVPAPTMGAAKAYFVLALLAGFALVVGWHAAAAAAVTTVLNVGVFLWDQQAYSSHRLLATLMVAYLVFARSDRAWSVLRRSGPVPWWPQLLMMTQLSACYLFAALSKLNGPFLSGEPLAAWVWAPLPLWMFVLMSYGTVVVEMFLAFGLWFRSTRLLAVVLGGALHLSIVTLMNGQNLALFSFAATCVGAYWLYAARPSLAAALAPAGPRAQVQAEASG